MSTIFTSVVFSLHMKDPFPRIMLKSFLTVILIARTSGTGATKLVSLHNVSLRNSHKNLEEGNINVLYFTK